MKSFLRFALNTAVSMGLVLSASGLVPLLERAAYGGEPESRRIEGQPLKLVVIDGPLIHRQMGDLHLGFEYEILQHFANDFGYRLKIKTVKNHAQLFEEIKKGRADIGAGRLTPWQIPGSIDLSGAYDEDKLSLICRRDLDVKVDSQGSLDQKSQFRLGVWNQLITPQWIVDLRNMAPGIRVFTRVDRSTLSLLRRIEKGKLDCAIADRLEAHSLLRFFTGLEVVKDISADRTYHFAISPSREDLQINFRAWLTKVARRQLLTGMKRSLKQSFHEVDKFGIGQLLRDQKTIFPQYAKSFKKHSLDHGIPWQISAAVSYQESHWNADAESFTGVRGIMQLTQETAEHLGVQDRLDPDQSIWGGVKYIRMLIDRQPRGLPFKEKLALALATYNVGPAHMIDAQNLALDQGLNPYSWRDLQKVLPLLADPDYLDQLKYGAARGHEPVQFVKRVFAYLELISTPI